jgi:sigma-B regulation protein RsbU (phosphoserine phosphatase)
MYETTDVELDDGDTLFLFTDGVTEAFNPAGGQFGFDRILLAFQREAVESAEECCRRVLNDVREWASTRPQSDDICMLALRRAP